MSYRLVLGPPGHMRWKSLPRIVRRVFVFLCVRAPIHSQVCRQEGTCWDCKVLCSMQPFMPQYSKNIYSIVIYLLTLKFVLFPLHFFVLSEEQQPWATNQKAENRRAYSELQSVTRQLFSGTSPTNLKVLINF